MLLLFVGARLFCAGAEFGTFPEFPTSPSGFKEAPAALIKFLERNKISELVPIPTPDQLKQVGLTEQKFEGYTGAAWAPNTTDPRPRLEVPAQPYRITNALFRVNFFDNYRKIKSPTFFVGEKLGKRITNDAAYDLIESRFPGIKLSVYETFYLIGRIRISCPYYFKFKGRYYSLVAGPAGTADEIEGGEKRSRELNETILIFSIDDQTFSF